jgi:hypothetical protein
MHRRILHKIHIIVALGIAGVLYFGWIYPSLHVQSRLAKAWIGSARRIVVFGDSFSDTQSYLIDAPESSQRPIRDQAEGRRWTEVLCEEFVCDSLYNFARTAKDPDAIYSGGAVLDNNVYVNTIQNDTASLGLLPDLKAQVEHWIKWESLREIPEAEDEEEVLFTITFGFWDIWQYATLELKEAESAIMSSIYSLFQQLDIIVEHSAADPRFVITGLWDITFSPHFQSLSVNQTAPHFGEAQHKMIYLVTYWNRALYSAASRWPKAELFVVDWQSWIMDQIRITQMDGLKVWDTAVGPIKPVFDDVSSACYIGSPAAGSSTPRLDPHQPDRCQNPERKLFWDHTHFSGMAHILLGKEAVRMVEANNTANPGVLNPPSAAANYSDKVNKLVRIHLIPSLAPGS